MVTPAPMTRLPKEKPRISNGGSPALFTPAPPIMADLDGSNGSDMKSGAAAPGIFFCAALLLNRVTDFVDGAKAWALVARMAKAAAVEMQNFIVMLK